MTAAPGPMSLHQKLRLGASIWLAYLRVKMALVRWPLPRAVQSLGQRRSRSIPMMEPTRLGGIVNKTLRVGPLRPRCLPRSMVLYDLMRPSHPSAALVIGLPFEADRHEAHAWVDIDGSDVGPPPGREGRQELVRYG